MNITTAQLERALEANRLARAELMITGIGSESTRAFPGLVLETMAKKAVLACRGLYEVMEGWALAIPWIVYRDARDVIDTWPESEPLPEISPWIDVKEANPSPGATVVFVVEDTENADFHGRVLGGRYVGMHHGKHVFTTPGMQWVGSYWIELPPAPKEGS